MELIDKKVKEKGITKIIDELLGKEKMVLCGLCGYKDIDNYHNYPYYCWICDNNICQKCSITQSIIECLICFKEFCYYCYKDNIDNKRIICKFNCLSCSMKDYL